MAGSLFGGPLSTRLVAADAKKETQYNVFADQHTLKRERAEGGAVQKSPGQSRARSNQQARAPRPPEDPRLVKKQKLSKELDSFDDLNDDCKTLCKPPKPQPNQAQQDKHHKQQHQPCPLPKPQHAIRLHSSCPGDGSVNQQRQARAGFGPSASQAGAHDVVLTSQQVTASSRTDLNKTLTSKSSASRISSLQRRLPSTGGTQQRAQPGQSIGRAITPPAARPLPNKQDKPGTTAKVLPQLRQPSKPHPSREPPPSDKQQRTHAAQQGCPMVPPRPGVEPRNTLSFQRQGASRPGTQGGISGSSSTGGGAALAGRQDGSSLAGLQRGPTPGLGGAPSRAGSGRATSSPSPTGRSLPRRGGLFSAAGPSRFQQGGQPLKLGERRMRPAGYKEEEEEELDDFIDDEEGDEEEDWRKHLREITGYDPRKFNDQLFDDRRMEASWRDVQAEERRSERLGRTEDLAEELAEQKRKEAKLRAKKG